VAVWQCGSVNSVQCFRVPTGASTDYKIGKIPNEASPGRALDITNLDLRKSLLAPQERPDQPDWLV
jgi:hypothetical protein